jgi:hypothetical protein
VSLLDPFQGQDKLISYKGTQANTGTLVWNRHTHVKQANGQQRAYVGTALQQINRNNGSRKIGLTMINKIKLLAATAVFSLLSACGGGGEGAGSNTFYPLSDALAEYVLNSTNTNVSITGSISGAGQTYAISGSGRIVESTTNSTFNGISAKKKTQTTTGSITVDGQTQSLNDVTYYYFNNNNQPLGYTNSSAYCISSNVKSIPLNISAGQTGDWYTTDCYTNSSKAVKTASSVTTYQIQAVTDKTADLIINQVFTDSSGKISLPSKLVYRMDTQGDVVFKYQTASTDYDGASMSLTITAN